MMKPIVQFKDTWNNDFEAVCKFVQLFPIALILHDAVWGPISLECLTCQSISLYAGYELGIPKMGLANHPL